MEIKARQQTALHHMTCINYNLTRHGMFNAITSWCWLQSCYEKICGRSTTLEIKPLSTRPCEPFLWKWYRIGPCIPFHSDREKRELSFCEGISHPWVSRSRTLVCLVKEFSFKGCMGPSQMKRLSVFHIDTSKEAHQENCLFFSMPDKQKGI